MNREEILKMPAGREMDALIAKRLFKLKRVQFYCGELIHTRTPIPFCGAPIVEHYSNSYEGFFAVWNKLVKMGRYPTMHEGPDENFGTNRFFFSITNPVVDVVSERFAHGICQIALIAVSEAS